MGRGWECRIWTFFWADRNSSERVTRVELGSLRLFSLQSLRLLVASSESQWAQLLSSVTDHWQEGWRRWRYTRRGSLGSFCCSTLAFAGPLFEKKKVRKISGDMIRELYQSGASRVPPVRREHFTQLQYKANGVAPPPTLPAAVPSLSGAPRSAGRSAPSHQEPGRPKNCT